MSLSKIYVVIPNLNGEDFLADCLDSLQTQTIETKVVVVDNNSSDSSLEIVAEYPEVELIKKNTNTGFTGGVNAGIKHSQTRGAEAIALLNNDAVVEKDWLENLVNTLESDEAVGIATSKILLDDKTHIDSAGDIIFKGCWPHPRGRHEVDNGQYESRQEVFSGSGGASIYRVEMLKEIGLFDDDYFAYLEDVDISFRAQTSGWKVIYEPRAVVYHKLSQTSSQLGENFGHYQFIKNFLLLYARNMPLGLYIKQLPKFIYFWLRLLVSNTLRGRLMVFVRANLAALKLHPKTLSVRKYRLRHTVISSDELGAKMIPGTPPRPPKLSD